MAFDPMAPITSDSKPVPITTETLELANGTHIPIAGHGSMEKGWFFDPAENARIVTALSQAIRHGLRLIDTAKVYATEDLVGRAVRESGVPRSEITIIAKLWNTDHGRVAEAFAETLNKLMLDYVDIYIIHWPCALGDSQDGLTGTPLAYDSEPTYLQTWTAMEALLGPTCRALGVSNFTQKTLSTLLSHSNTHPVVNEIEVHPLFPQTQLVPWCQARGIAIVAWGPLAGGPLSDYGPEFRAMYTNATLQRLAASYAHNGETEDQVNAAVGSLLLSWLYSRGIVGIPHSSSVERMVDNLRLVRLREDDVQLINGLWRELGGYKMLIEEGTLWTDHGPGGRGRTLFGWTLEEIGWRGEDGELLV